MRTLSLGRLGYQEVWNLQLELVGQRQRDEIEDTLILVEHDEVITLGRRLSAQKNVLAAGGVPVVEVERGGDVTYHGPGQLVGYPIMKLEGTARDLHKYLRSLEDALLGTLAAFGIAAGRNPGWTGAWIGERKVASIGIAVRKWVTFHGYALNVATELSRFAMINPCGLDAAVMTSMSEALGRPVTVDEVLPVAARETAAALAMI